MKRLTAVVAMVVLAATCVVSAQESRAPVSSEAIITHGEFAILLLKAAATYYKTVPDPPTALEMVQRLDLVPVGWQPEGILTHGELSDLLARFGVLYNPAGRDDPVSRAFAEATLRRELTKLRDYLATRMGHGFSASHILDEGVDRGVSPSDF